MLRSVIESGEVRIHADLECLRIIRLREMQVRHPAGESRVNLSGSSGTGEYSMNDPFPWKIGGHVSDESGVLVRARGELIGRVSRPRSEAKEPTKALLFRPGPRTQSSV